MECSSKRDLSYPTIVEGIRTVIKNGDVHRGLELLAMLRDALAAGESVRTIEHELLEEWRPIVLGARSRAS